VQALAQLVTVQNQRVVFNLPQPARELLRADDSDLVYYQVLGAKGEVLSGERDFPGPPDEEKPAAGEVHLRDEEMRGLDVRVVLPKKCDSRLVNAAARSYFDKLLKAGVRVYEYGPRMLHTKALLVDEDLSIIGTSNFDTRSFSLNFEIVLMFCDEGVAKKLAAGLSDDLAAAKEVTAKSRKPGFLSRLTESIARLFSPIL